MNAKERRRIEAENKAWEIAARANEELARKVESRELTDAEKIEFFDTYQDDIAEMLRKKADLCRENQE